MVIDSILLNTQHYQVRIKGKVEQPREWIDALPPHLVVVATELGAFGSPSTKGCQLYFTSYDTCNIPTSLLIVEDQQSESGRWTTIKIKK